MGSDRVKPFNPRAWLSRQPKWMRGFGMACLFTPIIIFFLSGRDEAFHSEKGAPRIAGALEEIGCAGVNTLERLADVALRSILPGEDASTMRGTFEAARKDYTQSLKQFRELVRNEFGGRQSRCRTDALAQMICKEGARLPNKWNPQVGLDITWGQYSGLMHDLANKLVDPQMCKDFHLVSPWIFQWSEYSDTKFLDRDPTHAAELNSLIALGSDYGNPGISLRKHRGYPATKGERISNVQHVLAFQRALSASFRTDLQQVVEFGGGTGGMSATLQDMGYPGVHIIFDMAPMNLLQLYWLRYSGHAAFLSKNLQVLPEVEQKGIVLQSAEDMPGFSKILDVRPEASKRSAFIAFWSFSEADLDAREKIRPVIQGFGRICIAFHHNSNGRYGEGLPDLDADYTSNGGKGVDVVSYFQKWVRDHLLDTHNTCIWRMYGEAHADDYHAAGKYYLMAVRKDLGVVPCLSELGCEPSTKHPRIQSTC